MPTRAIDTEPADWEMTVTDLKVELDRGEPHTIIDVRDPHYLHLDDCQVVYECAQYQPRA